MRKLVKIAKRKENSNNSKDPDRCQVDVTDDKIYKKIDNKFSILFSNVNGLKSKAKRLSVKFESYNDDIVCLNKTNYSEKDLIFTYVIHALWNFSMIEISIFDFFRII